MTSPEANEFFDTTADETVGADVEVHPVKRDFEAKQSTAQLPKKSYGTCRLVVTFHFELEREWLDLQAAQNKTKYFDGVDYLRAVVSWLRAEGKNPDIEYLNKACAGGFTVAVAK